MTVPDFRSYLPTARRDPHMVSRDVMRLNRWSWSDTGSCRSDV